MKIKLKKGVSLFNAIDELKASKPSLDFDVWYKLSKIQSSLRPAIESFEMKYKELVDDCAEKDDDGNNKRIEGQANMIAMKDPEKFLKGEKELNDKMVPVKIEKIEKKEFEGVKMEGSDNMFTLFEHVIK